MSWNFNLGGIANVHGGSWFGLPDLGITEGAAKIASSGQTTDLSDAIYGSYASTPTQQQEVNGVSTQQPAPDTSTPLPQTGNNTGGLNSLVPQGPSQAEIDLNNKIRTDITSGFDTYLASLDKQLGLLPEQQTMLNNELDTLFKGQKGTIDTQRLNTNDELGLAESRIKSDEAKGLRTLGEDLEQSKFAANNQLGIYGASDSTAAGMFDYALRSQANKNRGNLMQQTRQLQQDLTLKKTQLNRLMDDEFNKLETWKSTQLIDIAKFIEQEKARIIAAKDQTQMAKQDALTQLDQNALNRLQALDDQLTAYKQSLGTYATQRAGVLDSALTKVANASNFTAQAAPPQAIDPRLNFNQPLSSTPVSDKYGLAIPKKKYENGGGSW